MWPGFALPLGEEVKDFRGIISIVIVIKPARGQSRYRSRQTTTIDPASCGAPESSSGTLMITRTEDEECLAPPRAPQFSSALRSDVHEEASVKTGARRSRDFPDIHL